MIAMRCSAFRLGQYIKPTLFCVWNSVVSARVECVVSDEQAQQDI